MSADVRVLIVSADETSVKRTHAGPKGKVKPLTLDGFAVWLRGLGCSEQTIRHRKACAAAFLTDFPNFLDVDDEEVEGWLAGQRLSTPSMRTYRTHLRSLFQWAKVQGAQPGATLRPLGPCPGSARSTTAYGRQRALLAVPSGWLRPIEEWINFLLAARRPVTTIYLREYQIRRLGSELGIRSPFKVTPEHLTAWLADKPWASETVRSFRSALRSFFGWAHATGRMRSDPSGMLPPVRRPIRTGRPVPERDLRWSLGVADSRVRLMILLAARLGLRRSEIAALHTNDILPSDGDVWHLRVYGKGRKERVLPLLGSLRMELSEYPPGWIFPGQDGGHLSPEYVGKLLSRALGPYTGHQLRHRFATVAYEQTQDLFALQSLLGHAQPESTRTYVRVNDKALTAAVRAAQ